MGSRELEEKVINLKGIGEKTAKLFEKCGVHTCGDLIRYYPRAYDIYGNIVNACDMKPGEVNACKLTIYKKTGGYYGTVFSACTGRSQRD